MLGTWASKAPRRATPFLVQIEQGDDNHHGHGDDDQNQRGSDQPGDDGHDHCAHEVKQGEFRGPELQSSIIDEPLQGMLVAPHSQQPSRRPMR